MIQYCGVTHHNTTREFEPCYRAQSCKQYRALIFVLAVTIIQAQCTRASPNFPKEL